MDNSNYLEAVSYLNNICQEHQEIFGSDELHNPSTYCPVNNESGAGAQQTDSQCGNRLPKLTQGIPLDVGSSCDYKLEPCSADCLWENRKIKQTRIYDCSDQPENKLWTSRFTLERILSMVEQPTMHHLGSSVLQTWELYVKKSKDGVFFEDFDVIVDMLAAIGEHFDKLHYADNLLLCIREQFKNGFQMKNSKNVSNKNLISGPLTYLGKLS